MGVPCEILWDYVRPCQAVGQKESGLLAATWLSMYIHLTLDMHMQPVCSPVLPCPTMSYLLPFIVQAHVMMLDGMSCAGHELQCTIWQQPRRFPGGTVCKAFACFGIYVSFPLIVLQCPPDIWEHFTLMPTKNFQKLPETSRNCWVVFAMAVVSGWSREGRSWECNTPEEGFTVCGVHLVFFFMFCYVSFAQGIVQYCALIMIVNNCRHQHQCHHHQRHTSYIFIKGTSGSIAFFNSFHRFLFTGRGANGGSPEKEALRSWAGVQILCA